MNQIETNQIIYIQSVGYLYYVSVKDFIKCELHLSTDDPNLEDTELTYVSNSSFKPIFYYHTYIRDYHNVLCINGFVYGQRIHV